MKPKLTISTLLLVALFLTLAPIAFASTTWYVNGVSGRDSNNCELTTTACKTIGHAIALALSGDSIIVAASTYSENLTISKSLKIIGSSAQATIVDGGGNGTVFTISSPTANVTLSNFTIRNGDYGGGGGISNSGTLTISDSTISGNRSLSGGGIWNAGTLVINNSTLSGNLAFRFCIWRYFPPPPHLVCFGGEGGAVFNGGHLTINNGTLSGNSASPRVGGPYVGGIYNGTGTAILQNSIVANSEGNCYGTMTSKGYNQSSDNSCNFHNSGDRNNIDPKLGLLQNNGGPTDTMELLSGSPAIDAGNPSGCRDSKGNLLTTDQRGLGYPRPNKEDTSGCDIGAFERQSD